MKAIIMAGGEGTRLRPLTCDCPKPMLRLVNEPLLAYALALLRRHGVTEAAATLGYLPDAIRDHFGAGDRYGVSLRYTVEPAPLGTAGGVKLAADFLDETFAVLSGDGLTDLDLTAALAFHRQKGALATLVLKRTERPLEYGVVLTDGEGRVRAFQEKPDWGDVTSDTVNTGVYILEPEVLSRVPEGRPCDFGRDLFPKMVAEGLPVYGCVTDAYWCDVGDVRAYLQAHADALEGRFASDLLPAPNKVTRLPGARVDRAAVLEGPCVIGPGAKVLPGAYVGPCSVIGPGCVVGERASVKRSVLWPGSRLLPGAQARGCVLAAGAILGENAQAYEECVLGTGATVGARSVCLPGVKLWPGKHAADGARLDDNVVWGDSAASDYAAPAAPAEAMRAAEALCAALRPRELLLGRGEGPEADALWHAAAAGAMAQGARVLDAGPCALPQLRFTQELLGADCAARVAPGQFAALNDRCADLTSPQRRAVAAAYARQDFDRPFASPSGPVEPAPTRAAYAAAVAAEFTADPRTAPPLVLRADAPLQPLATDILTRAHLYARVSKGTVLVSKGTVLFDTHVSKGTVLFDTKAFPLRGRWLAEGQTDEVSPPAAPSDQLSPTELLLTLTPAADAFTLADAAGPLTEAETQLLTAWTLLERGERTLILPVHATRAARALARQYDAQTEYVAGEPALWQNALADRAPAQFALRTDGLRAALAALSALADRGLTLADWRRAMPAVARHSRAVPVPPGQAPRLLRALAQSQAKAEFGGGLRFTRGDAWAHLSPDTPACLRLTAEAPREETARELCDFCERELKRLSKT